MRDLERALCLREEAGAADGLEPDGVVGSSGSRICGVAPWVDDDLPRASLAAEAGDLEAEGSGNATPAIRGHDTEGFDGDGAVCRVQPADAGACEGAVVGLGDEVESPVVVVRRLYRCELLC